MRIVVTRGAQDGGVRVLLLERGAGAADSPLLHGADLSAGSASGPTSAAAPGPWVVVATGPDAGAAAPLPPGRWVTVGRDPLCDIPVQDPSLSRRHLRVRLDRRAVLVHDLGSTNGVAWESGRRSTVWGAGDRLLVGRSSLVLLPGVPPPAAVRPQDGTLLVRPWRRSARDVPSVQLERPPVPVPRVVRRPSAWMWALPLAIGVLVAAVLRMPWLLLFGLLGPAMILGHHLGERRTARLEHAEALAEHRRTVRETEERAEAAVAADLRLRREHDAAVVGVTASLLPGPSTGLWACVGEEPRVVVGEGVVTSAVSLDGHPLPHGRAPVTLPAVAPLAVVGPARDRDAVLRSLVLQLCTRHPPSELSIVVDPDDPPSPEWDLLAWLPHTSLAAGPASGALPLRWGTDLTLVDDVSTAPAGVARLVLHDDGSAVLQRPGEPDLQVAPTLLSLPRARDLARRLAPVRLEPAEGAGPPTTRMLGELLAWPTGGRPPSYADPSMRVPVGHTPDGQVVSIDLLTDGPHALIAGTTGSGKSELLRTFITGLALQNSPADLSLLLVDYKGGASLGACARLPHVTGLVTDLDAHLAERVLLSLQSELTRRERVLHEAGLRDIREQRGPGLPRLVVVVDEFRVLAEEVPEVMSGLVRVAAVGRSLGVHLILATQRPAGVVSADLRANVNLRIALRVRDAMDSYDVLECADAAHLPEGRPGLALIRTGSSAPRAVQVAVAGPAPGQRVDGAAVPPPTPPAPVSADDRRSAAGGPPEDDAELLDGWVVTEHRDLWSARLAQEHTGEPSPACGEDTEADPIAQLGSLLTAVEGVPSAPPVWLPPLTPRLLAHDVRSGTWAVADVPAQQRREELVWSGSHHVALVGSARSGRTTALCTLLQRARTWAVVLDLGRAMSASGWSPDHPRCCAWVDADDAAHALRVLDLLADLVQARQTLPRGPAAGPAWSTLVVVVDGWDRLVDLLGQVEGGRGVDVARRVLREGPGVGVVAAVSGDRSLLLGAVAGLLPETWLLPLNDPNDLMLTGLRRSKLPREQPPGRMLRACDGVHAQVVVLEPETDPHLAPETPAPLVCRALPRRWEVGGGEADVGWAVGGDQARVLAPLRGSVLVLGPPRSGRSQALRAIAETQDSVAPWVLQGGDPPGAEHLSALLDQHPESTVVVDDAHLLSGTPQEDLLVQDAAIRRRRLLVSADLEAAAGAFRGLVPLVARGRTAVVLQPTSPNQGLVVGATLPVGDLPLPGRGVLVERGRTTRVQVVAPRQPVS